MNYYYGTTLIKSAHSNNYKVGRDNTPITEICIHHCAGNISVSSLGDLWQNPNRLASSTYGINGKEVGLYVSEKDTAYCNSNAESNKRSISIEVANSTGSPDWKVSDESFETLVLLVADISKRHNFGKLILKENLTYHSMYSNTLCCGPYLLSKLPELCNRVNNINGFTENNNLNEQEFFIECLEKITKNLWQDFKLLPSVCIAQAILESGWGKSELAQKANNMFGIKTTSNWNGKSYFIKTSEYVDGKYIEIIADFRLYETTKDCVNDRCIKLTTMERYKKLVNNTDYISCCNLLQSCEWATSPTYAEKLINLINKYGLTKFDIIPDVKIPETPDVEIPETPDVEIIETNKDIIKKIIKLIKRICNLILKLFE